MRANRSSNRIVVVLAIALGAIVIAGGWLLLARRSMRDGQRSADGTTAAEPPAPARDVKPPTVPAPPARPRVASDGLGFMPPHDGDPIPPGPVHPHPISPQHERIFAENRIAFALDDATDAKDVAVMKDLLARYRREFPEDQWQLQSGYAVIIDCLEHPGPASRQAAERWLDQNNGSTVKRSVLRNCIEPAQP
ncbi:MAG TPA: hypothetical protein VIF57_22180 [Polyangia bacterium]